MRVALLGLVLAASPSAAQIATGDLYPLPERVFPSADGAGRTLAGEAGSGGLLVVFWSNTCPWAQRYAARLADLAVRFESEDVGMVLVNSNAPARLEAESAAATSEKLADAGIAAPALLDADGALARAFGARRAPHAFLFAPDGRLLYDGAIDDSPSSADRVRTSWLTDAMWPPPGAPTPARTPSFGCRLRLDPPADSSASTVPPPAP
jgi:hypothetical protein